MKIKTPEQLSGLAEKGLKRLYPDIPRIGVGMATCGIAGGAGDVLEAAMTAAGDVSDGVLVEKTGCLGLCSIEPLVDVLIPGRPRVVYGNVTPGLMERIVAAAVESREFGDNAVFKISNEAEIVTNGARELGVSGIEGLPEYSDHPFFGKQRKIALRNCGLIDLEHIEEYVARGGYSALAKALVARRRRGIINAIVKSGLRGRGGGGFMTGWKWDACYREKSGTKYVICNADEGDPGAYMDRSIMECDPHSVIEGMAIGAYAIGAKEGYIYIRTEYPLAVARVEHAIRQARSTGLLGDNIMGSGFDFDVFVARGSGAFVCGESSALIASIEGKPGEPRAKHTHMSESGLWGKPTVLNNVETWANVPPLITRGAAWFALIGSEKSRGTKVFSLVGDVNNSGLVEVPMGITLGEIVNEIGGGVSGGGGLKAIQTGGPSGGCIPSDMINLSVDFDSLSDAGSIMGSGGMIVMSEKTCMVDVARYFTDFLVEESCGKCVSCREGLRQMLVVLERICAGEGQYGDLETLEDLCDVIGGASLCGLGTSAPNPVRSTLKYFRNEYERHILEKQCPAHVCKALVKYSIVVEKCAGCGACVKACSVDAVSGARGKAHVIDPALCVKCGACAETCKFDAVSVE